MQVVMTINAAVLCYVSTPVIPRENAAACKVGTASLLAELKAKHAFSDTVTGWRLVRFTL